MGSNGLKRAQTSSHVDREYLFYPIVLVFCSLPFFFFLEAALNRLKTQSGSNGFKVAKHATETSKFVPMSMRFSFILCFLEAAFNLLKKTIWLKWALMGSNGLKLVHMCTENTYSILVFLFFVLCLSFGKLHSTG